MMFKTHVAFALLLSLVFLNRFDNYLLFLFIALASSLLPDIDSAKSYLGKNWFFRPLQWFVKHRGLLHSFIFCVFIVSLVSFIYPLAAFPFFLGYTSHLFADAVTKDGIKPFWPLEMRISGGIRTGGRMEKLIFYALFWVNILLIASFFV